MTEPFRLILYFFLYSFLGWCAEVAFAAVTLRKLVNRGFLNGPLCPIYGFGMVALLVALGPLARNPLAVFTVGAVLSTLIELFGGWVLYRLFHTRWWDFVECPRIKWWRGKDLNFRRPKSTDLQSVAFDRSATPPF